MEETKKIVKDKVVRAKFIKLLKQIDRPFTVKCVKNKKYVIDQNCLIIYKPIRNGQYKISNQKNKESF